MSQISIFRTREVRWFVNQPVPQVPGWFEELPPTAYTRESREDIYLVLPGRSDLGVKFRENRLELKYRLGESRPEAIAPGITGSFESWEKMGFQFNPGISAHALPEESMASRVPVRKQRLATQIEQTGTGVNYHPLGAEVQKSVQLEYTGLQVFGSSWYTVGLEWPDTDGISLPVRLLSGILPSAVFQVSSSMGYPEFLQRVLRLKKDA